MSFSNTNIHHLSDRELVEKYKATNDKIYVGELYKRYAHLVLGMCIQYFKDKDDAKDVVLQIFEKLFAELKKREVENFKAWLTFVVRNHCISELRKLQTIQSRTAEYKYEIENQQENEDEAPVEKERVLAELEVAIDNLNPLQKKCIELFYLRDMSYAQIVELTGFSVKEVKSYIQNGKRNLRLMMESRQPEKQQL